MSSNNLLSKLNQYASSENAERIAGLFNKKIGLRKNEHLIQVGANTDYLAYIEQGLFQIYFIDHNGEEKTVWFSPEDTFVTDLLSYYKGDKARYYVKAIESSIVHIVQKESLNKLYTNVPSCLSFGRNFAEEVAIMLMERMVVLQTKSAKERYRYLLSYTNLVNRVPLKHLATFLGITETSLSRIRRNYS